MRRRAKRKINLKRLLEWIEAQDLEKEAKERLLQAVLNGLVRSLLSKEGRG